LPGRLDGRWVREAPLGATTPENVDDEALPEEWPDLAPLLELFGLCTWPQSGRTVTELKLFRTSRLPILGPDRTNNPAHGLAGTQA